MIWVRWTTHAADDLAHIVERIREHKPEAAQRVTRTICTSVASLRTLPHRGRMGLAPDTRELVFPPWPYIVVYGLSPTFVQPGAMALCRYLQIHDSMVGRLNQRD